MVISIVSSFLSFFLLKGLLETKNRKIGTIIAIFFYLNCIFLITYIFMNYLSGDGINDAILFHLKFGIKGFGANEYILPFIFFIFLNLILLISLKTFVNNLSSNITKTSKQKIISIFVLLISFIFNPFYKDVFLLFSSENSNIKIDSNFYYEQDNITNKNEKNIIFIYLEQIERTYLNNYIFPNLTPNLSRLDKKSISFTDIDSPRATNWTIAGMAASQCGIPLLTPIASENSMSGIDKFMPLANCIGDILSEQNYQLHYVGGSDLDFAGKGNFYKSHGFEHVEGWYELEDIINDRNYRSPWGIYDDELLNIIYNRAEKLNNKNINFGLFSLTLDTHHPNGYISKSCKNNKYQDGSNPILNSVHCVDELIGRFMDAYLNSKIYDDTILVLLSDHLALKNTATNMLEKGDRKNLFMIFDKSRKPQYINSNGNVFDVGPTVMGFLGLNTDGLGLGRNLITSKSLSETHDMDFVISLNKRKILDLWSFPSLGDGFKILDNENKILFGERFINYPALIVLNSSNEVDQIMFDFYYANPLKNKVQNLGKNINYVWIDKCSKIYSHKNLNEIINPSEDCLLIQDSKNIKFKITSTKDKTINSNLIKEYFNDE